MSDNQELIDIKDKDDATLSEFLKENSLSLKIEEVRKLIQLIGRNPTETELHIFNTQWSEHSSYKSSKEVLKMLPTKAPNVILGPQEDAGIVELGFVDNKRYGIVMAHESHNHPSQVVPYEGAATGIGGILRDVLCMGAKIIGTADPLRFGDSSGKNKNKVKYIANEVVDGIAGYGNAVGIPNLAGDIYFNKSFDDNCLVNVVCLGLIKEEDIIHSSAPKNSEGYDIIVVGKGTDNSGFGGAAFSSLILDEDELDSNRGAVQVPDPFLKNIIIRATYKVFEEARKRNITIGFKDMGAGGIMCSTSEMCSSAGLGAEIDLDKVNVSIPNLPPFVITCSETQERFTYASPPEFTSTILKIYNEEFELPKVSLGAKATVVGKVTKNKDYVLKHQGNLVCNVPIDIITSGIKYSREKKSSERVLKETKISEPKDYADMTLKILSHPNVASKASVYNHYDKEVLCNTVIRAGEADAGLIAPLKGTTYGVALSVDHNPRYSRIDPYWGAVHAVAEAMRNVAAIGAIPSAMTDCLNFGNPEKPEVFQDFYDSVKGIADAAKKISYNGTKHPVPIVSGNVSFYNESTTGTAVDPSPIIACLGIMKDYTNAVTMKIKEPDNILFLIGNRGDELGGSVYLDLNNELGATIPIIDFEKERNSISSITAAINKGLVMSCHDISDGGLITTISEMILGGNADGEIGAEIDINFSKLRNDNILFGEHPGFVIEVKQEHIQELKSVFKFYNIELIELGKTSGSSLIINKESKNILKLPIKKLKESWTTGFKKAFN
tara:strand:- start:4283 stop:6622 length:2340 start_codon:yes stop_codon:yes gene_type:complete